MVMTAFVYPAQSPMLSQLTKLTGIIAHQSFDIFASTFVTVSRQLRQQLVNRIAILATISKKTGVLSKEVIYVFSESSSIWISQTLYVWLVFTTQLGALYLGVLVT
jgi:hypothetical protein